MPENRMTRHFARQAEYCLNMGSPVAATTLARVAADYAAGGVSHGLLSPWDGKLDSNRAFALRLISGLHYLVLSGRAPGLADYYPSSGGTFRPEGYWEQVTPLLEGEQALLRDFLGQPNQTNEIGRAGTLLGGFLLAANTAAMPIRCLEVGASAGLLLNWHRYHYALGDQRWGDPDSPVRISNRWHGRAPDTGQGLTIAGCEGCDVHPIDPTDRESRLRLRAYVWPDRPRRARRLEAAMAMAADHPVPVEQASASGWLARQLAAPRPGTLTVVYTSLASGYFDKTEREAYKRVMLRAGRAATPEAPIAWLRLEVVRSGQMPSLRMIMFPGKGDRHLASGHLFGASTYWSLTE